VQSSEDKLVELRRSFSNTLSKLSTQILVSLRGIQNSKSAALDTLKRLSRYKSGQIHVEHPNSILYRGSHLDEG
jgi:hypothetical protein